MDTIESIPCALAIVELTNGDPVMCAKYCANLGETRTPLVLWPERFRELCQVLKLFLKNGLH